jgi:hypothetical protein
MKWPLIIGSIFVMARLVGPVAATSPAATLGQAEGPSLPASLTELESAAIRRERGVKSRVETVLKIAETRLGNALLQLQRGQYPPATQQLIVHTALIVFADQSARALPPQKQNDRDHCLKKIEQAIFRQNTRLETIMRELPFDYQESSRPLVEQVRKIRLQAINDLLGGGGAIKVPEERQ